MMPIPNLKNYIIFGMVVIIAILSIWLAVVMQQNIQNKVLIAKQNASINQYLYEVGLQQVRLEKAEKEAKHQLNASEHRVKAIQKEIVPNDCEGVFQYGIEKAIQMRGA